MTVGQLNSFIATCRLDAGRWAACAASTAFGKPAGVVNGYQICEAYVKPFTRGSGCGVALLLNPRWVVGVEYREKPDNLSFAGESDWQDVFVGYFPSKRLALAAACHAALHSW